MFKLNFSFKKYIIIWLIALFASAGFLLSWNKWFAQTDYSAGLGPEECAANWCEFIQQTVWSPAYCDCGNFPSQPAAPAAETNKSLLDLAAILDTFMNFMYIILWPMLAITGLALDNSLVYGWAFGITDMLFKFWRIMNVVAFLILVVTILRDILSWLRDQKDIGTILKGKVVRRIMLGVMIPASWFLVSVLVDVSTLLIYNVGAIPLTILKDDDSLDRKLLESHSNLNLTDSLGSQTDTAWWLRFRTIYTCGTDAYISCKFENNADGKWQSIEESDRLEYLSGQKGKFPEYSGNISKDYCVLSPTELLGLKDNFPVSFSVNGNGWSWNFIKAYTDGQTYINKNDACLTISNLINQSQGMVGPLYTIYGSLLNFASLNITDSNKSTEAEVMLFMIKAVVWILLIFPLIALGLISIARVGLLWMIIAFSPLLMFTRVGGKSTLGDGVTKEMDGRGRANMWAKLKTWFNDVLSLIFQPVMTVLALSLSIVMLSAMTNLIGSWAENSLLDGLGVQVQQGVIKNNQSYQCLKQKELGYGDVCVAEFNWAYAGTVFFNYFTRIIANILGILIMRNLLFMSLKFSKMTSDISSKVEELAKLKLETLPVFGWKSAKYLETMKDEFLDTAKDKLIDEPARNDIQAAKDANTAIFNRMGGSKAMVDHTNSYANAWIDNKTDAVSAWEAASSALGNGISAWSSKWTGLHANSNDVKNWGAINTASALNWLGFDSNSLEDAVWKENFWHTLAVSDKWRWVISNTLWYNNEMTDEAIRNLVGNGKTKTFRANLESWINNLIKEGIKNKEYDSWKSDNYPILFREANHIITYNVSKKLGADWKTQFYQVSAWTSLRNKVDRTHIWDFNSLISQFPDVDFSNVPMENNVQYSTDNNTKEFKNKDTAEEIKAKKEAEEAQKKAEAEAKK